MSSLRARLEQGPVYGKGIGKTVYKVTEPETYTEVIVQEDEFRIRRVSGDRPTSIFYDLEDGSGVGTVNETTKEKFESVKQKALQRMDYGN